MRGYSIITIAACTALFFSGTARATCQSDYFTCLTNPSADISACITQNAQCLNNEYTTYLNQQKQAYQTALTQFYSNPVFSDPVLAALYGYDPAFVAAAQNAVYENLAIQAYLDRQQRAAQAQADETALILKLINNPGF